MSIWFPTNCDILIYPAALETRNRTWILTSLKNYGVFLNRLLEIVWMEFFKIDKIIKRARLCLRIFVSKLHDSIFLPRILRAQFWSQPIIPKITYKSILIANRLSSVLLTTFLSSWFWSRFGRDRLLKHWLVSKFQFWRYDLILFAVRASPPLLVNLRTRAASHWNRSWVISAFNQCSLYFKITHSAVPSPKLSFVTAVMKHLTIYWKYGEWWVMMDKSHRLLGINFGPLVGTRVTLGLRVQRFVKIILFFSLQYVMF